MRYGFPCLYLIRCGAKIIAKARPWEQKQPFLMILFPWTQNLISMATESEKPAEMATRTRVRPCITPAQRDGALRFEARLGNTLFGEEKG